MEPKARSSSLSPVLTCFIFLIFFAVKMKAQSYWGLEGGIASGLVKCYPEASILRYLPHASIRLFAGGGLLKELTLKEDRSPALIDFGSYLHTPESFFLGEIAGIDYRRYLAQCAKHDLPHGFYFGCGCTAARLTRHILQKGARAGTESRNNSTLTDYFGAASPDLYFGYQNLFPSSHFLFDIFGSISCYCSLKPSSLGTNDVFLGRSFLLHINIGKISRRILKRSCPGPL
jgi:hypothetical protein